MTCGRRWSSSSRKCYVGMSPVEMKMNALMAINFLVSLLKENWNNVQRLHMKSD